MRMQRNRNAARHATSVNFPEMEREPMVAAPAPSIMPPPARITRLRDTSAVSLQRRLEEGWDLIEAARLRGEDIRPLEEHWLRLLEQYELQCQQEAA